MTENPYASSSSVTEEIAVTPLRPGGMLLTALSGVGLTLGLWVFLVMMLDGHFLQYENQIWAGTLWFSAMLGTGLVAYSRYSVRPVLVCTLAFGIFGIAYMACEGPIFGAVAQGGDPSITKFVVWNLVSLPMGVFAATQLGSRLQRSKVA